MAGDAWSAGPSPVTSPPPGRAPLVSRARGLAAGTLLACGSVLAVTVHAADSSSQSPDTAHPGLFTVDPGVAAGGDGAKGSVAALSTAASLASRDRNFAEIGSGPIHRNRPLALGVAGESSPQADLSTPLALSGSEVEDGQQVESGSIQYPVAPPAPKPGAATAVVGHVVASVDQAADPVSSLAGEALSASPEEEEAAPGKEAARPTERVVAPTGKGAQPAMTMLSARSHS